MDDQSSARIDLAPGTSFIRQLVVERGSRGVLHPRRLNDQVGLKYPCKHCGIFSAISAEGTFIKSSMRSHRTCVRRNGYPEGGVGVDCPEAMVFRPRPSLCSVSTVREK